jgi:renalase
MSCPLVAIIGAGISGLACGQALREAGAGVVVFEKSRSLGGRLATRRWEGHVVDHGAPWFSPGPEDFRKNCGEGRHLIQAPVMDASKGVALTEPDGGRWYLPAGNNRLAKPMAAGLEVRVETLIETMEHQPDGRWQVAGEAFDAVVLTAPWPQTRRLLAPWLADGAEAAPPRYVRTLTAFFEYGGDPSGPAAVWSGIEHGNQTGGLSRSICENHKTGRILPGRTVIVAHGTPAFSEEHFESERELWSGLLESEAREAWELPAAPRAVFSHRWGFSTAAHPFAEIPVLPGGIHLAGDAVSGSQIGAVYASGRAAAQTILTGLRS